MIRSVSINHNLPAVQDIVASLYFTTMKERWLLWSFMENLHLSFSVPTSPLGIKTLKIRNKFVYFDQCHCLLLLQDKWRIARNPITFPARSNLSDLLYFSSTIPIYLLLVCESVPQHLASALKSIQQEILLLQLFRLSINALRSTRSTLDATTSWQDSIY